jgi:hypothetical protein
MLKANGMAATGPALLPLVYFLAGRQGNYGLNIALDFPG